MIVLNGLTLGLFTPRLEVDAAMEKDAEAQALSDIGTQPKKSRPEVALNQKRHDPFSYAMRPYI